VRSRLLLAALLLLLPGCVQVASQGPCVQVSLDPEVVSLQAGQAQTFLIRARNCGDVALSLGDGGRCDAGNGLNLTFAAEGRAYRLGHVGGAVPAERDDPHVCVSEAAAPRTIRPGESQETRLAWNGTLMESTCFAADCAERYHDAPAGDYTLTARVAPGQGGAAEATVVVRLAPRR
jgi:hypothetical protein